MIRKKKINKNVIYILSVFILLLIGYGIYEFYEGQIEKRQAQEEISEKLLSDKKYGNLEIQNIKISELEKNTSLTAQIKNESDSWYSSESVNLVFLDENGNVVCSTTTDFPNIGANESSNINVSIEEKCKNSYTFVIEKLEEEGNNGYE